MNIMGVVVGLLSLFVIGLCYMQWQDMKKFREIDGALGTVADSALSKFRDQVKTYTEEQVAIIDKRLKDQAASLGISMDSVKQSSMLAKETQTQVQALLEVVNKQMQDYTARLQTQADSAISQIAEDLQRASAQSQDELVQRMASLADKYQQYEQSFTLTSEKAQQELKSIAAEQQRTVDEKIQQAIQQISDLGAQQSQAYIAAADQRDAQSKTLFDSQLSNASQSLLNLQTSTVDTLKQQSDVLNKQFVTQIGQYYNQQVPVLLSQLQTALQNVVNQSQSQMQAVMYKYGYRRQITDISVILGRIDGSNNGLSLPATQFKGLTRVVKTVGPSIATYTCTLPAEVPFQYDVFAQIYPTKAAHTTLDNDISIITKPISQTQFAIIAENLTGAANDNTIAIIIVEK